MHSGGVTTAAENHQPRFWVSTPWLLLVVSGVLFKAALDWSYVDFVSPIFEYAGFVLNPNAEKFIEAWAVFLLMLCALPRRANKPSDYLLAVAFFCFITPLLVFYGHSDGERWVLYYTLIQYAVMVLVTSGRPLDIIVLQDGPTRAMQLAFAVIVASTAWMLAAGGLSIFNLDLDAVYDFREEANTHIYAGVLGYIVVWSTTVFGPFVLMLALERKKTFAVVALLAMHVFWFGLTSHKSVLFYPLVIIGLYVMLRKSRSVAILPACLAGVVLISLLSYYLTESLFLSGMFVRRVFFVPAHLTYVYMQFFEHQPMVYWSNSVLSWAINYPYDKSIALIIGESLGDTTLWANNSFFSTGYMHAGIFGVILYGAVAGLLLKILDSIILKGVPFWMALAIVIVPFFSLFTSSDLPTSFLTHGIGAAIFVLYLMGRPMDEPDAGGSKAGVDIRADSRQREEFTSSP